MKRKGFNLHRAKHLGWRNGDPTRDVDLSGNPVESNYAVIVRIADCETEEKEVNGRLRRFYKADKAPSIPTDHGATYYSYGKARLNKTGKWFRREDKSEVYDNEYITIPVYLVEDGIVYKGNLVNRICRASNSVLKEIGDKLTQEKVDFYVKREAEYRASLKKEEDDSTSS